MSVTRTEQPDVVRDEHDDDPERPEDPSDGQKDRSWEYSTIRGGPLPWLLLAALPATVLSLFWRVWQQLFAFTHGLDVNEPGFNRYWLSIFLFNILVLPLVAAAWFGWLWYTGRKLPDQAMDTETEVRRIWMLWVILVGFAVATYWGGSYFTEQDAAWHQVTLRDTAFTPSHTALFYGAFPLMLYGSIGAFLYARTRLSHMFGGRAVPLGFVLLIAGNVLLIFQVAFNEFGHTFWETEEIFNAPLHWPFVFFAYFLAATFAVLLMTVRRLLEINKEEEQARLEAGDEEFAARKAKYGIVPVLGRRWDVAAIIIIALIFATGLHMESTLFAGEWSFWTDWKDRQWWPLVTPAANMILIGTASYALWRLLRLPVGGTLGALVLVVVQIISRGATFELWANLPLSMTWPETLILLGVLLDVTMLLTRSYLATSLIGGLAFGGLFWYANYFMLAPYHEALIVNGQVFSVADWIGFTFPKSQGPEYIRIIEEGHLRALVGNVTAIVAFFAGMLSFLAYWVGVAIARLLIFFPMDRKYHFQTDTGEHEQVNA